jgi:lipopolysaccharide heptosyltransferase I
MNILIVRLGALGDIVHAIPAAAALRRAHPSARIDWIVDARHRGMVDLVRVLDNVITVEPPAIPGWVRAVRELRSTHYDVALDLQGLMKSAVLARASGARRIIGFSIWHLREKTARPFYSEVGDLPAEAGSHGVSNGTVPNETRGFRLEAEDHVIHKNDTRSVRLQPDPSEDHVIHKNLRLLRTLGVESTTIEFPLRPVSSVVVDDVRLEIGEAPFALVNPGAAWPNKRWPPERFGAVTAFLRDVRGMRSLVLWGPGEAPLAHAVVEASDGAAIVAPPTQLADLVALSRAAALMISGDTGPLHIAAAVGTPIVAIFGPTDPLRNGPFSAGDVVVSRHAACRCHYERRCRRPAWCLADVGMVEVTAAIQQRLSRAGASR